MTTLLLILWFFMLGALVFVSACRPIRTKQSLFELKRKGDEATLRRERLLGDVLALKRVVAGLLFVGLAFVGTALWQAWGVVLAIILWLAVGLFVRWRPLHTFVMRIYGTFEVWLLSIVEDAPAVGYLFRDDAYLPHDQPIESVEHLLGLVDVAKHVLTDEQRAMIHSSVNWHATAVKSVMTPVKKVVSIKHDELIGPLVLDDLHQSGHVRFPVIRGSVDDIIGVLDITDLLEISTVKSSQTAKEAMKPDVKRIKQGDLLPAALEALQKGHRHLLAVTDQDGKTVGIVTLSDVVGSLLGKNRGEMVK